MALIPCAFYDGVWVSSYEGRFDEYKFYAEEMLKTNLREGMCIPSIQKRYKEVLDDLREELEAKTGEDINRTNSVWGDKTRDNIKIWVACIHILLRTKVLKNDEANGFGFRWGRQHLE